MKPNRHYTLSIFLFAAVLTSNCFAQDHSQLRLKLGMVKNFESPSRLSQGYAYRTGVSLSPYPVLGLEYAKPFRNRSGSWVAGASLDMQSYGVGLYDKNLTMLGPGRSSILVTGVYKFYVGIEKKFTRKEQRINKNYFTWFAGLGVTINPFSRQGDFVSADYNWYADPNGYGSFAITNDGRQLKGTELYLRSEHAFSPVLMAGVRWHIRNKRGNEVMIVELVANYGLTPYFNYEPHYRLNDLPAVDRLPVKGIYVQLNVVIPLANFGKKRK